MTAVPNCPKCARPPIISQCEPWPRKHGPAPWYVGCYQSGSDEHFVGVNGDTKSEAIANWYAALRQECGR